MNTAYSNRRSRTAKQIEQPDGLARSRVIAGSLPRKMKQRRCTSEAKLSEVWDDKGKMKLIHSELYATVIAIPNDMLISGYRSEAVNSLRLWQSTSPISIDMELFAKGEYLQSMEEKHQAEIISKILYPEDAHDEGKILRMKQQYFFISASMQALTKASYADLRQSGQFP